MWMDTACTDHSPPVGVPLMSAFCIPVFTQFTALKGFSAPINKANVGQWFSCSWQRKPLSPGLKSVWSWCRLSTDLGGLINGKWLSSTERKVQCVTMSLTAEAYKCSQCLEHTFQTSKMLERAQLRRTNWSLEMAILIIVIISIIFLNSTDDRSRLCSNRFQHQACIWDYH